MCVSVSVCGCVSPSLTSSRRTGVCNPRKSAPGLLDIFIPRVRIMDTMNRRRRQKGDPCSCLRPLIRLWGVTTAIGMDICARVAGGRNAASETVCGSGQLYYCGTSMDWPSVGKLKLKSCLKNTHSGSDMATGFAIICGCNCPPSSVCKHRPTQTLADLQSIFTNNA